MKRTLLRNLPSIDEVLNSPAISSLVEHWDRDFVVGLARDAVESFRSRIMQAEEAELAKLDCSVEAVRSRLLADIESRTEPSLRGCVNATGVVLHTGLGRAVLPEEAAAAVLDAAQGYCTLEIDAETGHRGDRNVHFSRLLCELTGAEAATAVNNNAAATLLALNTLAAGKEVIVSRGQLVEIGGSFRMPEVMAASGAVLREVGTTNKTRLADYENAINENTGAILRVHMSNYRIVGFFEEPGIAELVELGHRHGLPVVDDLGSGALIDLGTYGLESDPLVRDSIKAGVDAACFSGDKLIGGPQCGILVGRKTAIEAMRKNPLARALRIGKLEIAALEETLKLFLQPGLINERHPVYRMLSLKPEYLGRRARAMARRLKGIPACVEVVEGTSQVGSGSVPGKTMPTMLLSIRPENMSAETLARALRNNDPPVFPRIRQEAVLLDLRTIQPEEDRTVTAALRSIFDGFAAGSDGARRRAG